MCPGNQVRDEYSEVAVFQDFCSSFAMKESGKAVEAYGCIGDHILSQSHACQAYVQTMVKSHAGLETEDASSRTRDGWLCD